MNSTPENRTTLSRRVAIWAERLAPAGVFVFKLSVAAYFVWYYAHRWFRIMYIADAPARGIEAYRLAYVGFTLFPEHQFPPLTLWLWAALLKVWPDIYWTGTALNVIAGAGTAVMLYYLGRRLGGYAAGLAAALFFTFSPVHHNLTVDMGMAESIFYFWLAAGVVLAARAETGLKGRTGATWCFAAAALCRYEATAFLGVYALYCAIWKRPRKALDWILSALPLAIAALFLGHKAFQPHSQGLWPALAGVRADTIKVLSHPVWYRRLGYSWWRIIFDGRAAGVLALAGAVMVWLPSWRRRDRLAVWAAPALLTLGLTIVFTVVGVGFCPERYMATPLMLLFPFAGLVVAALFRKADSFRRLALAVAVLAPAVLITASWDATILKPGYGYAGPANTRPVFAAETALRLRELWARGELKPEEVVLIEMGNSLYEEYPLRAYTDRPLNFLRDTQGELHKELPYLAALMKANGIRIAIILSKSNREAIKQYYDELLAGAVVTENPTHTVVVLKSGWREFPDFRSRFKRDGSVVLGDTGP